MYSHNRPSRSERLNNPDLQQLAALVSNGSGSINEVSQRLTNEGHRVDYVNNQWLARTLRGSYSVNVTPLWAWPARATTTTPLTVERAVALYLPGPAALLTAYEAQPGYRPATSVTAEVLHGSTPGMNQVGAHRLPSGQTPIFEEWRIRLTQHTAADDGKEETNFVEFNAHGDLRGHSFRDEHGESNTPEAIEAAVYAAEVMATQLGFGV